MPSFLGAADSFNSSSATIRPGPTRERERASNNAGLGVLGPQDSVGREFEALLSGRAGVLQSDAGVGDQEHLNRYLREYARMPSDAPNPDSASPSGIDPTLPSGFNPLQFLTDPVAVPEDTDFFAQVTQVSQANLDAQQAAAASSPFAIQTTEYTELYRPTSALSHHSHQSNASHHSANSRPSYQSHRSNVSLSSTDVDDSGFYTTDMDTDDAEFATGASDMQPSPSPLAEIGALNLGTPGSVWTPFDGVADAGVPPVATISPEAEALGSSSRRAPPSKRSVRGIATEDEEKRRLDRLEHRRSINRRSAQKHRLRRKEELETLTQQIAERDQKIAALEKDLAVTKAQLTQLAALIKSGYQFGKDGGAAGGPAAPGSGPGRSAS